MRNRIYLTLVSIVMLFVFTPQITHAQNKKKEATKKVVKKTPKRVSSKMVVYKNPKKKVVSVRALPKRTIVKHNNVNYYHSNNNFYAYSGGRYTVIVPKVGFRIKTLPANRKIIRHHNGNYFWLDGIFYIKINNEYEVVEPEIGTVIYELPNDYERVVIDGLTYYEFSNVLYEKVQVNGTRAYEVVGFIEQ